MLTQVLIKILPALKSPITDFRKSNTAFREEFSLKLSREIDSYRVYIDHENVNSLCTPYHYVRLSRVSIEFQKQQFKPIDELFSKTNNVNAPAAQNFTSRINSRYMLVSLDSAIELYQPVCVLAKNLQKGDFLPGRVGVMNYL